MTQIYNKELWLADPKIREDIDRILEAKPVKNLTDDEVLTTLRLMQLQEGLQDGRYNQIVIHRKDKRLEKCDDQDRFLAMLLDCDSRDVLLFSGRCRSLFGGSVHHWRKIARQCPITAVASAISECGMGYYGRGWEIAPHIQTLRKWINNNINNLKENNNEK